MHISATSWRRKNSRLGAVLACSADKGIGIPLFSDTLQDVLPRNRLASTFPSDLISIVYSPTSSLPGGCGEDDPKAFSAFQSVSIASVSFSHYRCLRQSVHPILRITFRSSGNLLLPDFFCFCWIFTGRKNLTCITGAFIAGCLYTGIVAIQQYLAASRGGVLPASSATFDFPNALGIFSLLAFTLLTHGFSAYSHVLAKGFVVWGF